MKLPPLENWETTAPGLHQAAMLLGAMRMLVREPVPNYLELAMRIEPYGLSTDTLPSGGAVLLDFQKAALVYRPKMGDPAEIPLEGHNQASLLEALLATLDRHGEGLASSHTAGFLAALEAKGHPFTPKEGELTGEKPLEVDAGASAAYGEALYRVFTATARFRAQLNGPMTPVVVWPEHFDLSFLWFATERATDRFPHMNFGFAPFDGLHPRPYLYAYAYLMPEAFTRLPLPEPARWHTEGWQGAYVPYDELAKLEDPESFVERSFSEVHRLLSSSLATAVTA